MNAPTTSRVSIPSPASSSAPPPGSDHDHAETHRRVVAAGPSAPDQSQTVTHPTPVGGNLPAPTTIIPPIPIVGPSSAPPPGSDHVRCDNQSGVVAAGPSSPAIGTPTPTGEAPGSPSAPDHLGFGHQKANVGGNFSAQPSSLLTPTHDLTGGWAELRLWAEILEDIQQTRKANYNRIGETTDGRAYRLNVDPDQYRPFLAIIDNAEKEAWSNLVGTYRRIVPPEIIDWQRAAKGVGEKRLARILGHLGDPYIATPHRWEGTGNKRTLLIGDPYQRTVSQLWAYCGLGDPHRKHRAGMTAEQLFACGSVFLKSQVWNMASEVIKVGGGGQYRPVYDERRAITVDRVHVNACPPCHAKPGDPWKPGHQHTDALRVLGKRLLRDLWLARREGLT